MPFPPTFTNVWDTTFPPDTQAANLLGQDLRNFRTDVMQRMSLLSGTFANRPTPEIVNATWGGVGYGLLYFSTDTGQIFQWNGGAWVDISQNFESAFFKDNTDHIHTGTVTEDVIYTNVINGGQLGTNGVIRATIVFSPTVQGGGGTNVNVKYGGVTFFIYNIAIAAQVGVNYRLNILLGNKGVTNAQRVTIEYNGFPTVTQSQVVIFNMAIDSTVNQNFSVTSQSANNTDSQSFFQYLFEIL